ncbi:hypothetical protein Q7P37_007128 [Cladosporium fusiforme]
MSTQKTVRDPSHAGSWYTSSKSHLNSQLDGWLNDVETPVQCIGPRSEGQSVGELPVDGARIIIGPHAGFSYSGPAAAWAYKSWDVRNAKRVFLLGPSHKLYLEKAALTRCTHYGTPLGDLPVDTETTTELHESGLFQYMSQDVDENEHSLEMHLPYIYKILSNTHGTDLPPLVPIMVGNTSASTERSLGQLLAPYLADPSNAFVISSDFAHWGTRFSYTYYQPSSGNASSLRVGQRAPTEPEIHGSIKNVDFECMGACESGSHQSWLDVLRETGNTVCGRHPIGVIMAGLESVRDGSEKGLFKFVRYERSGEVKRIAESSVSYASAFAVL